MQSRSKISLLLHEMKLRTSVNTKDILYDYCDDITSCMASIPCMTAHLCDLITLFDFDVG